VDALTKDFIERKARGQRLAVLTAYDYPTARLLDEAGADMILVGDSLGMVMLGLPDTTGVTMNMMLHHAAAVRRAVKRAPVVVDLPAHAYDLPDLAVHNARRLVTAGADAVKLEGGVSSAEQVKAITSAGISHVGHIGMLPQSIRVEGTYKKKGRTDEEAARLIEDARALEEAGSCAIVLESVVSAVAEKISKAVKIPTISVGPSEVCDGEVLVIHDLLGSYPWFKPPFAKSLANVAQEITRAAREYVTSVRGRE
jgi:3-methyl-2-oxobutanoate hydroxymethyltransferase